MLTNKIALILLGLVACALADDLVCNDDEYIYTGSDTPDCYPCPWECADECPESSDISSLDCEECVEGYFLVQTDWGSSYCSSCDENCVAEECPSSFPDFGYCSLCAEGYFVEITNTTSGTGSCQECDERCLDECPQSSEGGYCTQCTEGYYVSLERDDRGRCEECPEGCLDPCPEFAVTNEDLNCTTCDYGFYLVNHGEYSDCHQCFEACADPCPEHWNEVEMGSSSYCTQCLPGASSWEYNGFYECWFDDSDSDSDSDSDAIGEDCDVSDVLEQCVSDDLCFESLPSTGCCAAIAAAPAEFCAELFDEDIEDESGDCDFEEVGSVSSYYELCTSDSVDSTVTVPGTVAGFDDTKKNTFANTVCSQAGVNRSQFRWKKISQRETKATVLDLKFVLVVPSGTDVTASSIQAAVQSNAFLAALATAIPDVDFASATVVAVTNDAPAPVSPSPSPSPETSGASSVGSLLAMLVTMLAVLFL